MKKANVLMNRWLRGERVDKPSSGAGEISDKQFERMEKYLDLGVPYTEARDLVLSFNPGQITPGNAGEGRGDLMRAPSSMNDFIRAKSGRFFV
jgi:hypothetical protein